MQQTAAVRTEYRLNGAGESIFYINRYKGLHRAGKPAAMYPHGASITEQRLHHCLRQHYCLMPRGDRDGTVLQIHSRGATGLPAQL